MLVLVPGAAMPCLHKVAPVGTYTGGVKVLIKGIQDLVQEPENVSDP